MNRSAMTTLAIAIAVAIGTAPSAIAATPGDPAWRAEIDRIVKEAQDEGRRARENAQRELERAQDEGRRAREHAQRDLERARDDLLTAQADALAQVDLDLDASTLAFFGNDFGAPREIVKNAPYTADAVTEMVHVLQDGNRIVKRTVTRLARDTVGRTRQEKVGTRGTTAFLFDPIDNRNYALDLQRKVAVRIPRVPAPPVPPMPYAPVAPVPPVPPVPPVAPVAPVAPGVSTTPMTPPTPGTPVAPVPAAPSAAAPLPPGGTPVAIAADGNRVVVRRGGVAPTPHHLHVEKIPKRGDDHAAINFTTKSI
jgi:hypothetical protein